MYGFMRTSSEYGVQYLVAYVSLPAWAFLGFSVLAALEIIWLKCEG